MELFAFYILVRTQIADILEIYGAFYELFHNKHPGNSWEHSLKLCVFQDWSAAICRTLLVLQASHGELNLSVRPVLDLRTSSSSAINNEK